MTYSTLLFVVFCAGFTLGSSLAFLLVAVSLR